MSDVPTDPGQGAVIPSDLTPQEILHYAILGLEGIVLTRYMLVAAVVLAVYDWLLNLDREVQLVHRSRWTLVKAAYLFSRYYTLLVLSPYLLWAIVRDHHLETCRKHFRATYLVILPSIISAQLYVLLYPKLARRLMIRLLCLSLRLLRTPTCHRILMLRTYAFTGQRRWVLWTLALSLAGVVAGNLIIVLKDLELVTVIFDLFEGKSGCFASTNLERRFSFDMALIFVLIFCFDALNIAIIVGHVVKDRNMRGDLYQTVLKHGFLYYLATCTVNILTTGTYFAPQRASNGFASWFAWILPSMLSCSLVLALRHVSFPTQTEFMVRVDAAVDEALEVIGPASGVAPRGADEIGGEFEGGDEGILLREMVHTLPRLSSGEGEDGPKSPDASTPLKRGNLDSRIQDV